MFGKIKIRVYEINNIFTDRNVYINIYQNGVWVDKWKSFYGNLLEGREYEWFLPGNVTAIGFTCDDYNNISYVTFDVRFYFGDNVKLSADLAKNAANNAYTAANAAKGAAESAKTSADTAASRVWDSTESKSAATLAKEARNYASTAATNAQNAYNAANTAANQTIYNGQSAAYWANLAAANIAPVINKVQGQNGATCTTGTTFTVVISAAPSSGVSYRVTCGSFDSG